MVKYLSAYAIGHHIATDVSDFGNNHTRRLLYRRQILIPHPDAPETPKTIDFIDTFIATTEGNCRAKIKYSRLCVKYRHKLFYSPEGNAVVLFLRSLLFPITAYNYFTCHSQVRNLI